MDGITLIGLIMVGVTMVMEWGMLITIMDGATTVLGLTDTTTLGDGVATDTEVAITLGILTIMGLGMVITDTIDTHTIQDTIAEPTLITIQEEAITTEIALLTVILA